MSVPAKLAFSAKYRSCGISGESGLLDHDFCWVLDMTWARAEGESFGVRGALDVNVRVRVLR